MSEEMKEPMQTDNDCKTEEAAASTTETMADYEDHFDDANPWNLVTKYMEAINTDTIMVHVRNIREKIEIDPKNPKYLKVVWGVGYKIEKQP